MHAWFGRGDLCSKEPVLSVIDQILGWLMVALGTAHCVTSFRIQPLSHISVGLTGTAVAIIIGGFLNLSRARNKDGLMRAFAVVANLLVLALAVGLAWPVRYNLLHNWQMLGILVVTVIELLFSFRG
jgi:hypothetical protein